MEVLRLIYHGGECVQIVFVAAEHYLNNYFLEGLIEPAVISVIYTGMQMCLSAPAQLR